MKMTLLRNYNYFVGLIWGALMMNFVFQYSQHGSILESVLASACILIFAYPLTTYLSTVLLRKALEKKRMKWFLLQFLFFSAITTICLLISGYGFTVLEQRGVFPGSDLFSALDSPTNEILNLILVSCFINFGFCGLRFFEETLRLQQELTDSQMEILKTQINPHFMFNVLNHIHVLMQKDVELASSLLLQYSDILRYQLYQAREEKVAIGQEIEFLQNYIEVEKLRWKGKLIVTTCWELTDPSIKLAPLLFIPFVENAFKHVARSDSEKGTVDIEMKQKEDKIVFKVVNSKMHAFSHKSANSGIGLENIRRRLDILYPERYELNLKDSISIYTVELILKIHL